MSNTNSDPYNTNGQETIPPFDKDLKYMTCKKLQLASSIAWVKIVSDLIFYHLKIEIDCKR